MERQGIILLLWLVSWIFIFFLAPLWYRKTHRKETCEKARTKKAPLFKGITFILLSSITVFYTLLWNDADRTGSLYGLILVACGQALMAWSRLHLGNLSNQEFINELSETRTTQGPYRYAKHPMYIGLLTALSGSAIVTPSIWAISVLIFVVMPLIFIRSRIEASHA